MFIPARAQSDQLVKRSSRAERRSALVLGSEATYAYYYACMASRLLRVRDAA